MSGNAMYSGNISTKSSDLRWPVGTNVARPGEGAAQVWCGVLRCAADTLSAYERILSAEESDRASRFRTEELRHRFVASRGLLRTTLGHCLSVAPERVRFHSNANGKPKLADEVGIDFNLSHSADLMLLAITAGATVGVDVERIRSMKDLHAIARRFFSVREADWLQQLEGSELERGFFRIWTRKEAILKATGEGISNGLSSIEVLDSERQFADLVPGYRKNSEAGVWSLTELHPAPGFVGALALPAGSERVQLQLAALQNLCQS